MTRFGALTTTTIAALAVATGLGAAPATTSYRAVERAIDDASAALKAPESAANAPGWAAFFDATRRDLRAYAGAPNESERLRALGKLYREWTAMAAVDWAPVGGVRDALAEWLRPRVLLAWAGRGVVDAVSQIPESADAATKANRDRWVGFVDDRLGGALREYESAPTVAAKQESLRKIYAVLDGLQRVGSWGPATNLKSAVDALFNRPNMHATADAAAVSRRLANPVVTDGPVTRKGNTAFVTAGPFEGFGLLPSDEGIAFYNRQAASSVTPTINNFQGQVASDPKGRRAAKLYNFAASTTDAGDVTVVAVIRPGTGLQVYPAQTHNTQASVTSSPTEGHNLGRAFAKLLGLNQQKITQKVYEGAIGQIRSTVAQESAEEAQERSAEEVARQNATIRENLRPDGSLEVNDLRVAGLALRSRPTHVEIDGTVQWRGGTDQVGADFARPASLGSVGQGIVADVHLSSLLTNLSRGYLESDRGKATRNLMVVTRKIPPGTPPKEGVELAENVDFPTFSKAVDTARAANDPQVQAIRVKTPGQTPVFSADRDGHLVALIRDMVIEVPAPAQGGALGQGVRILRLEAPNPEFVIDFKVETDSNQVPVKIAGRILAFDPGPGAKVFTIDQDETKAAQLNPFTASIVLSTFGNKLKGQPIDAPLTALNLPNFQLGAISALDPTGWLRVVLTPKG